MVPPSGSRCLRLWLLSALATTGLAAVSKQVQSHLRQQQSGSGPAQAQAAKAMKQILATRLAATEMRVDAGKDLVLASAARAQASQERSEQLALEGRGAEEQIAGALTVAARAAEDGAEASATAAVLLKGAEAFSKTAEAQAADLTVKGIQDMLSGKFRELQPWHDEVFSKPPYPDMQGFMPPMGGGAPGPAPAPAPAPGR
eukprot:TRINITY_DN107232_c0_g1_i1.p1 TRINITY_DN107232_c0_g1~~TRINITY_DN107232_c0_g1_i1.p1  ORF type:complete len:201 (-),score=47.87 TRINITY_DN107232_c0_g1_i1:57-659(-)